MSEVGNPDLDERLERFKKVELTGTGSFADLPIIASQNNLPPPETAADSPMSMADAVTSPEYLDLSKPKLTIGDPAFDFALPRLDLSEGAERYTGETLRLSDHLGVRPIALIFGSYT